MEAVILAAGIGRRLRGYFDGPKCLLKINGKTLLSRYLEELERQGAGAAAIVVGYKKEKIMEEAAQSGRGIKIIFIENKNYAAGSILSFYAAKEEFKEDTILMDADVYFEPSVLERIMRSRHRDCLLIDRSSGNDGEAVMAGVIGGRVVAVARGLRGNYDAVGEWVGFTRLSENTAGKLLDIAGEKISSGEIDIGYEDCVPELLRKSRIACEYADGLKWTEIDFREDVKKAEQLLGEKA